MRGEIKRAAFYPAKLCMEISPPFSQKVETRRKQFGKVTCTRIDRTAVFRFLCNQRSFLAQIGHEPGIWSLYVVKRCSSCGMLLRGHSNCEDGRDEYAIPLLSTRLRQAFRRARGPRRHPKSQNRTGSRAGEGRCCGTGKRKNRKKISNSFWKPLPPTMKAQSSSSRSSGCPESQLV